MLASLPLASSGAFAQCAMCSGAAGAGSDGGGAYNLSTLLMLAVPYLLLLGVAGYVVYAFRKARPAPGQEPLDSPQSQPIDRA